MRVSSNNLEKRVRLMGTTNNVPSVLQGGDIFVFPSAYEGFGLSLGEAMSMGLPAIGYASCSAVNEIIVDGETGLLVEDGVEPLAAGMKQLMDDQNLRVRMGQASCERMKQYAPEVIWEQWEELLNTVQKHK